MDVSCHSPGTHFPSPLAILSSVPSSPPSPGALGKAYALPQERDRPIRKTSHPCQSTDGFHLTTVIGWGMSTWLNSRQWNARVGLQGMEFWERYFLSLLRSYWQRDAFFLLAKGMPLWAQELLRPFCLPENELTSWKSDREMERNLMADVMLGYFTSTMQSVHPIPELCRLHKPTNKFPVLWEPLWVGFCDGHNPRRSKLINEKKKALIHSFLLHVLRFYLTLFLNCFKWFCVGLLKM